MNIKDCLKERILRKIPMDLIKVESSLKIAEVKFEKARNLLKSEFFEEAVLSAYTSMFHAARALLYKDGLQEKSHFAVYIYIHEKYSDKISKSLINAFYNYQKDRHRVLYGFDEELCEEDAKKAIFYANDFLISIKGIIN
jgi:uncharacterized protein (UPF0332 family)